MKEKIKSYELVPRGKCMYCQLTFNDDSKVIANRRFLLEKIQELKSKEDEEEVAKIRKIIDDVYG